MPLFHWLRLGLQIVTNELDLARERYTVITAAAIEVLLTRIDSLIRFPSLRQLRNTKMMLFNLILIAVLIVLPLSAVLEASSSRDAPAKTVTIDGMTVPDIGPLPTSEQKGSTSPIDAAKAVSYTHLTLPTIYSV